MRINRTTATVGLATLGLVTLTGGGIAWASADGSRPSASSASANAWHCPGGYAMAYGKYAPMTAVADYLGMTRTELADQLSSGKTLAEIAQAHGKTVAGLKTAMVSAMKRNLAADTDLTDAQRTAILAMMNRHVDAMVSGRHLAGIDEDDLDGMMGGAGGGMMGGRGGGQRGFGSGMMGS